MASYLFNNDFLITETGEINAQYIKSAAKARAQFKYGPTCTQYDIRDYEVKLAAMAELQRGKFLDGLFVPASNVEAA